ncbi:MAG: hypothetical protein VYE21_11085, partial [Pseudomonadota bacterium]|nr:hypothetical protein [Pseudomonadota bacterium]
MTQKSNFEEIYTFLNEKFANETEYLQAVHEVLEDIVPIHNANIDYKAFDIIRRICMPERIIYFTVSWMNSDGNIDSSIKGYESNQYAGNVQAGSSGYYVT